jgi:hypothetical protein
MGGQATMQRAQITFLPFLVTNPETELQVSMLYSHYLLKTKKKD